MRAVLRAATAFPRALTFVRRHGMGWLFLMPMLLMVLLGWGTFSVLRGPVRTAEEWVARVGLAEAAHEGLAGDAVHAVNTLREWAVSALLRMAVLYMLYLFGRYIVLILLSPLMAWASERTEEILTGRTYPFSWRQLARDALRGSLVALRNGALELLVGAVLWAATLLLPLLAPVSTVLVFLVAAYFSGFSMFDYILERRRLSVRGTVKEVDRRMALVVTNGALFNLLIGVPGVGILLAPVLAPVAAVLAEYDARGR